MARARSKRKSKSRLEKELEKWALRQFKKYVEVHKKHEKDLRYIG